MVGILSLVDKGLAAAVAFQLGLKVPEVLEKPVNRSIPADGNPDDYKPIQVDGEVKKSEALSMENTVKDSIKSRKIAFLVADGVDAESLLPVKEVLLLPEVLFIL
ncbi:hypothetical protein L950_0201345 [Sphingobacterium sp. IITKGP-BTPF85]|nr:hypothetical protein L950_0201345 [Sphingobacterium sp. IITKGP-BTPF85]